MTLLVDGITISTFGMKAQGQRMRVIAENLANANTAPTKPGEDPYSRKEITFKNQLDRQLGLPLVQVHKIRDDKTSPFQEEYMPDHPAADARGYVKMPNISTLLEMMDMREAQRSYEANLGMYKTTQSMLSQTIDVLKV